MTYKKRSLCRRCQAKIRIHDGETEFLLPMPNGEIRMVKMHARCVGYWSALATSKAYSDLFQAKRKAFLRKQGIFYGEAA